MTHAPFAESVAAWLRRVWNARLPTREAIVITALLAIIFECAYLGAYFVRGELLLKATDSKPILTTIGWVIGMKLVLFYWRGFCHRPWRAARFEDLNRLLRTATTGLLLLVATNYFAVTFGWPAIPRSVLLLDWMFTLLGVGGMQAFARSIYEEIMPVTHVGNRNSALVIDASKAGRKLVEALPEMGQQRYFVAGLLDDDPENYGVSVGAARVLGPVAMAPTCAERLRVSSLIIREGAVFGDRLRALCDACGTIGVQVSIAEGCPVEPPGATGRPKSLTVSPIRLRNVELADFLARPHARLEDDDYQVGSFLGDRRVLVTGAAGSVGGELCRQVLRFHPSVLVMADWSEAGLFEIYRELSNDPSATRVEIVPLLCDVSNASKISAAIVEHAPDVILHAAAYKHLPLMESHPIEAIENNTLATAALADLAIQHGVGTFVMLSTDKAVYPSSLMGASKLVAERYLAALAESSSTKFVAVRFGNVLGSSGSVVPIFTDRLSRREPVVVTDPAVRRRFVTLDEAAQLVLLAGAVSHHGGVYVLDMGDAVPIVDLVGSVAFVMGVPKDEVQIEFCGLRPGEKLDEETLFDDEELEPTASPLIHRAAGPVLPIEEVRSWLETLRQATGGGPDAAAAALQAIGSAAAGGDRVPKARDVPPRSNMAVT